MLKVQFKRAWWVCLIAIAASYPLSVYAADSLGVSNLSPPFVIAWIGVWVFAIAGGVGASFIHITDVDSKLRYPALAKIVLGTFWGMALCLAIESLTSTPMGALPLFALGASCFSAPICAGAMVYISNQKRLDATFDVARDTATMRVFGRKAKRGDDETDTL